MPLVLIVEDGTGKAAANGYVSVADADAYFEGRADPVGVTGLFDWSAQSTANKEKAIVSATRMIDAYCRFYGHRAGSEQALQWPRYGVPDPDAGPGVEWETNVLPGPLVAACCEQARELLIADRTAAPLGEGMKSSRVADSEMVFDRHDRAPVLCHYAAVLLSRLGDVFGQADGPVRVVRC